jgi:NAD(P)H-hydrate epimerase
MSGKLVRDNIPKIIREHGKEPVTHIAGRKEYLSRLNDKLIEEAKEFAQGGSKEELADLMEVFIALCKANQINRAEIERIRKIKHRERGGFDKQIILDVIDKEPEMKEILASTADLAEAASQRNEYSTKFDNGRVLVIGGSEEFHGAPALAAGAAHSVLAAMRTGAGYVHAFVPREVMNVNRAVSPSIIVRPLKGRHLSGKDNPILAKEIAKTDCLVLGNGLGRERETLAEVVKLVKYAISKDKLVVVDADGLYAISKYSIKLNKNVLITPNKNEFGLFYDGKLDDTEINKKAEAVMKIARKINANVLLKGRDSFVSNGDRIKIITAVPSAMQMMGTGDVLAGMIGGYAANNRDLFASATAACYAGAIIGRRLEKEKGNHLLPTDVIDQIPYVLKEFDK